MVDNEFQKSVQNIFKIDIETKIGKIRKNGANSDDEKKSDNDVNDGVGTVH